MNDVLAQEWMRPEEVVAYVEELRATPKPGHRGNIVLVGDGPAAEIAKGDVLIGEVSLTPRRRRALLALMGTLGRRSVPRAMDALPIELNRMQIKVIVLTHAERLWQGLTGKMLVLAQAELKWLANESGARVVLVGGIGVVEPIFEYAPLAWRFTWMRRKEVLSLRQ